MKSRPLGLILGTLFFVSGCNPSTVSDGSNFGRFEGDIVASWSENGRDMILRDTFTYIDSKGRAWAAPAGAVVNGASIPDAFWSVIGGPFEGKYRNASVVHDVGCDEMRYSWEVVHEMFYEACRCGGVDEAQAKMMYYAVYHFGPRWEPIVETVVQPLDNGTGQVVMQEVAVERMARVDPVPPTAEELEQVEAFVTEENPHPDAIRNFDRNELRRRPTSGHSSWSGSRSRSSDFAQRWQGHQEFDRRRRRGADSRDLQADVQESVIAVVRQHVEQQSGEQRPAVYKVQPFRGAYRVDIQFVHEEQSGQVAADTGGSSTALVSREGKLIEFINNL